MLTKIKEFFLGKPPVQEPVVQAPYKVEAPAVVEVAPALAPIVEEKPNTKTTAKKTPAVKPAVAAKTPRARKTPAK